MEKEPFEQENSDEEYQERLEEISSHVYSIKDLLNNPQIPHSPAMQKAMSSLINLVIEKIDDFKELKPPSRQRLLEALKILQAINTDDPEKRQEALDQFALLEREAYERMKIKNLFSYTKRSLQKDEALILSTQEVNSPEDLQVAVFF